MAYITKSNFHQIIKKIEIDDTRDVKFDLFINKFDLFDKYEIGYLFAIEKLYSDTENIITNFYKKIPKKEDEFKYIFEGGQPAYHLYLECEKLNSNFQNYPIPSAIKEKGEQSVINYRNWFKNNIGLLEENPTKFIEHLQAKFTLEINLTSFTHLNSGSEEFDNLNLEDLKTRINELLTKVREYYKSASPEKQYIIDKYKKRTFLSLKDEKIRLNTEGIYTDSAIRKFLKTYYNEFKKPLKELLINYFRVKYNENLKFEGKLLESLGFKVCSICKNKYEKMKAE